MNTFKTPHLFRCHPVLDINIVKADDCTLYDDKDKAYLDFESGIWCANIGHTHPNVIKQLKAQSAKVIHLHTQLPSQHTEELAQKLTKLCNMPEGYATFLSSGSEAVQLGLTIGQIIHPEGKVIALADSYFAAYKSMRILQKDPNWTFVDFSRCFSCPKEQCSDTCSVFSNIDIASHKVFALELGSCSGKNIFAPHKLVTFIANVIHKNNGIVISNEVTTGFGRTGSWFAHRLYGIQPDMIAMGKALGSGYPISALVMSRSIGTHDSLSDFKYAQSHQNDPLGCVVANAVLDTIVSEKLIERAKVVGAFFKKQLEALMTTHDCISDVRGQGLMLVLELSDKEIIPQLFNMLLEKGFFVGTNPAAGLLRFYPPMTIKEEDIVSLCQTLAFCIGALGNKCE